MKRLLGIDFGLKRIGIAITDPLQITARPLKTITYSDTTVSEILYICRENEVESVILGKPEKSNNNKEFLEKLIDLADKLKNKINVEFWDESFSSKIAMEKMIESGKKKKFRKEKGNLDAFAAAGILTEFINNG